MSKTGMKDASQQRVWEQEHAELIDYVNSIAHRKVWLPADFERAGRAVSEIERADSLRDLEGAARRGGTPTQSKSQSATG